MSLRLRLLDPHDPALELHQVRSMPMRSNRRWLLLSVLGIYVIATIWIGVSGGNYIPLYILLAAAPLSAVLAMAVFHRDRQH